MSVFESFQNRNDRKYVRNKFQETNFVINYAGSETRKEGVGIRLWGYNFFSPFHIVWWVIIFSDKVEIIFPPGGVYRIFWWRLGGVILLFHIFWASLD